MELFNNAPFYYYFQSCKAGGTRIRWLIPSSLSWDKNEQHWLKTYKKRRSCNSLQDVCRHRQLTWRDIGGVWRPIGEVWKHIGEVWIFQKISQMFVTGLVESILDKDKVHWKRFLLKSSISWLQVFQKIIKNCIPCWENEILFFSWPFWFFPVNFTMTFLEFSDILGFLFFLWHPLKFTFSFTWIFWTFHWHWRSPTKNIMFRQ